MISESVKLEMLAAVKAGDTTRLGELVDRYGLYEIEDYPRGSHLLTRALWHRQQHVARLLLRRGAEVDCQRKDCYYGCLPLHLACKHGYKELAKELIEKGANVNLKDNRQRTPLYYSNGIEIFEILLGKNAIFDIEDIYGNTPLHHLLIGSKLSQATKLGLVDLFVGYGAAQISRKDTLMHELIEHRNSAELFQAVLVFWKHKLEAKSKSGDTVLHYAARHGRDEEFKLLVEEGADVNARDANGSSALHIVVKKFAALRKSKVERIISTLGSNNYLNMMEFLASRRSLDINSIDDDTYTALHYAIQHRIPYAAGLLIESGADPDAATCSGQTPLSLAVTNRDGASIRTLVSHGADLSVLSQNKTLICDLSESSIDSETLETVLIKAKSWVDLEAKSSSGDTALLHAIRSCQTTVAEILIQYGARIDCRDADDMCPLHLALKTYRDAEDIIQILLANAKHIDIVNMTDKIGTPLHHAILNNSPKMVQLLLDRGADVNAPSRAGETRLLVAMTTVRAGPTSSLRLGMDSNEYIIQVLLDRGANILAPLRIALQKDPSQFSETIIDYILSHNSHNERDAHGNTALHCACEMRHHVLVERLIRAGSDLDASNDLGETPLHLAIRFENLKAVGVLLRNGANVMARTNDGLTPVHVASQKYRSACIIEYLEIYANLSNVKLAIDRTGKTALHHAIISCGNVDNLVKHNVVASDPDYEGKTPLDLAFERGNVSAVWSLLDHLSGHLGYVRRSQIYGHEYDRLCQAAMKLAECVRQFKIDEKCDKFMFAVIIESSRALLYARFGSEKLYWLDGETSPNCLLMRVAGAKLAVQLFEAKLTCGKELMARVCTDNLEEFELTCADEVANLKRAKIDKRNSLYDFLHNDNPSAFKAMFANANYQDKDVRRLLYLDVFPIYRSLILSKIWRDSKRIELLSRARVQLLDVLPEEIKLREIADNILRNFTNFQLMLLVGFDASKIIGPQ